ncbi:MAG: alpha-amylase family glycosyl hydrolase [Paludibacteraceae bacterium]
MTIKSVFILLLLVLVILFTASCKKSTAPNAELLDSIAYHKTTPEWVRKTNIYEVNIRQYTPEGTFKAFQEHLPRLKSMGVDILWIMPIQPVGLKNRKGTLGSYYSIMDYTAVNPEFGTEEDFKALVEEAHKLGMHVIIDWVANHTSWDNVWIQPHADWYTKDSLGNIIIPKGTDWKDTADLNYDNPDLRRAMIDAMKYWIKNTDIDGFRCDVAGMVPLSFWLHVRREIDELKPNCFFLAEDESPAIHAAFDATYNWKLKDIYNSIAKGKKNVSDLLLCFAEEAKEFGPDDILMNFTTNHDLNSWDGSEYERLGDSAVNAFTVLTYVLPGMPLTYTGQEEPLKKRLSFFEKDTVGFKNYDRQSLLTKLNLLKKDNKVLWNVSYRSGFTILKNTVPNNILSFVRTAENSKLLCVFNFSPREQTFKITDAVNGSYKLYMGDIPAIKTNTTVKLKPWGWAVLEAE